MVGFANDVLHVKIAALLVKGKANEEIAKFLSRILEMKQECISIRRGHTSRNKIIVISGLSREEVFGRILSISSSGTTSV